MLKEKPFSIKSEIELIFNNSKIRDYAYSSFLPELKKSKSWRSTITMQKTENSLKFLIASEDITAYRAAVSDIVALGKIIESTTNIFE